MKTALVLLVLFASASAQAANTVVCALIKNSDKTKYISVKLDLTKPLKEYYQPETGLSFGSNGYSFVLEATLKGSQLHLVSTFQDSNDEVGQSVWNVNLSKSEKGKPVVVEPLKDDKGRSIMTFVCYHNKP
ncbi:MAG: hypothetical protein ABL958_00530 [Bdellovibrionia bacterium]